MSSFKSSVGGLGSVKFPSEVPHIEKVVVDAPFLDKGTLTCEMSSLMSGARRSASSLLMILAIPWIKLIGL